MGKHMLCCTMLAALVGCASGPSVAGTVTGISVFHRSGQTFITWRGVSHDKGVTYRVYQSDTEISSANLSSAHRLTAGVAPGSGLDAISTRHVKGIKIVSVKDPQGTDWWYENTMGEPEEGTTPRGYIIREQGSPLPLGTELFVHTTETPGIRYYAVTVVDSSGKEDVHIAAGVNATRGPVEESVGQPEPLFEKVIRRENGAEVRQYIRWSDNRIGNRDGVPQKFQMAIGPLVKQSKPSPLLVILHGAGAPERLPIPVDGDFIVVVPDNFAPGFSAIYDWWYGYNSNFGTGEDLTKGVNTNYSERRVLDIIDWVRRQHRIDPNRIYLAGASMGGTGTLTFGLRHPELFAAIFANVPHANTGLGISDHEAWFQSYLGKRTDAIQTTEGISIWDRLNMTAYVSDPGRDLPFVKSLSSRDDPAMPWMQAPPFIKSLNESRHGFISGWGIGSHNMPFGTRPMTLRRFDFFRIVRNESFPAFSNSSMNDDPGNGDPKVGAPTGIMGGGFSWKILSDTPRKWEAEIKVVADAQASATTDITPRRLQHFKVGEGSHFRYTVSDLAGKALQAGEVTADRWRLITVPAVPITTEGVRLSVERE